MGNTLSKKVKEAEREEKKYGTKRSRLESKLIGQEEEEADRLIEYVTALDEMDGRDLLNDPVVAKVWFLMKVWQWREYSNTNRL
jgi:hypothetical protein